MWLRPAEIPEPQERYLDALGRALVLAQNFEQNCKFVFGTWDMGRAYRDGQLSIDEWRTHAKKLHERSLGAALKAQHKDSDFSPEQIGKLEAARAARNHLAHEAGWPGLYLPPMSGNPGGSRKLLEIIRGTADPAVIQRERMDMLLAHIREAVPKLEGAVRALAEADSMVAGWSYMIQEKNEYVPSIARTYTHDVTDWVLEPLRVAGLL